MFLKVSNNTTKEESLALIATNGIRLYSSSDNTGNSDTTITNSDFISNYTILGVVSDETEN
ncbi:hypothetical protein ACSW8S_20065 (plasmid) [Clostridium perfringens]